MTSEFRFKIASEPREFQQIRELNYRTFVDEIPQHPRNDDSRLVDKFESDSTYAICLRGEKVVGMVCIRGQRPFSLDHKIENLDAYLPAGRSVCEIRLLAVDHDHRGTGLVFRGLTKCLARHCYSAGYDLAVISGTERQLKLYRHLGFTPFGPRVGTNEASFQPMYLTLESFQARGRAFLPRRRENGGASYLPGPVKMYPEVQQALREPLISHRGTPFVEQLTAARSALCALTHSRRVELLLGSGTLANDAVAAQLAASDSRGIVMTNGEFGERLADHASRWQLDAVIDRQEWGAQFQRARVADLLQRNPDAKWLWTVHCETSTGMLNDIAMLASLCRSRGVHLCLDCISSIGTVPVDLSNVYLATGVSGKALGAPAGISMVFHNHDIAPNARVPRYLDVGLYEQCDGSPFTHSSALLGALVRALDHVPATLPTAKVREDSARLRRLLRLHGFEIVVADSLCSPAVTTVALPPDCSSLRLGSRLDAVGFGLSYRSEYLLKRNWIQVCLMGDYSRDGILELVHTMTVMATERPGAKC